MFANSLNWRFSYLIWIRRLKKLISISQPPLRASYAVFFKIPCGLGLHNLIIYPPTTIGSFLLLSVMKGESHNDANLFMYQLNLPNHLIAKIFHNHMKSHFGGSWLIMIKREQGNPEKKASECPVDWQNTNTMEVSIINQISTMFQASFISITSSISLHMSQTKGHGFCRVLPKRSWRCYVIQSLTEANKLFFGGSIITTTI